MTLDEGWMKRQMIFAAEATEKWPDWMKQEAGIHQKETISSQQETSTSTAVEESQQQLELNGA